jgi:hypothetical protein
MGIVFFTATIIAAWFEDRTFVNVGNNVGVPRSAVTRRANENGITRDEAARELGAEIRAHKVAD